nr:conserved hypothetical protein [uncultured archaeon GZfos9D8]
MDERARESERGTETEIETERDELLWAIVKGERKSALNKFFDKPMDMFREKPVSLFYVSSVVAVIFSIIAFLLDVPIQDVILIAIIMAIIPPGLYDSHVKTKIRKIDAHFPSLLGDLAHLRRSGMPLGAAMGLVAQGQYGVLTKPIKWIDSQMTWGVTFEDALARFAKRYPTPLIRRSISIIIEASRAGGEIGEILEAVAEDAHELKILEVKRKSETTPYLAVSYLSYFVFVAVIMILCTSFLPMMEVMAEKAAEKGAAGGAEGGLTSADIELFKMLFFHALVVQGFFAGVVAGKIGEGSVLAGLKHSLIFVVVSFIVYTVLM